jgi:hypothetical protein
MTTQQLIKLNVSYARDQKHKLIIIATPVPQKVNESVLDISQRTRLEDSANSVNNTYEIINKIQNKIFRETERLRSRHKSYHYNSTNTIKKNNCTIAYMLKRKNIEEVFT